MMYTLQFLSGCIVTPVAFGIGASGGEEMGQVIGQRFGWNPERIARYTSIASTLLLQIPLHNLGSSPFSLGIKTSGVAFPAIVAAVCMDTCTAISSLGVGISIANKSNSFNGLLAGTLTNHILNHYVMPWFNTHQQAAVHAPPIELHMLPEAVPSGAHLTLGQHED